MFTDSHCHLTMLNLEPYNGNLALAIDAAVQAGVDRMMSISVDLDDAPVLARIAQQYLQVGYSVGVHPCEDRAMLERASVEALVELARHDKVWAIGETGLDYYHSQEWVKAQQACFIRHIEASQRVSKPLIVHTRHAKHDTIALLRAHQAEQGILHCFTEDWSTAKAALDLGFYISFSGIISFKNASDLRDVVRQVPLDRLLIETDSPYLAPVPYRGKANEPKFLPHVAQVIADLFEKSIEEIAAITTANFDRVIGLHST